MKLSRKEKEQVKQVAKELLDTLKAERLVLDWRKKQQARRRFSRRLSRCWISYRKRMRQRSTMRNVRSCTSMCMIVIMEWGKVFMLKGSYDNQNHNYPRLEVSDARKLNNGDV